MIEIPSDIGNSDVHQWLSDGAFFARKPDVDGWQIAFFGGISDDRYVVCHWADGSSRSMVPLSDVRAHWPACGSINMPKFALYVQRLQRRQWRRTFNARCVSISIPAKWQHLKQVDAADLRIEPENSEFLEALFNPVYPTSYTEAMQMMQDRPSVALSPQILLVGTPNPQVYYRGNPVGQMVGGRFNAECDPLTGRRVGKLLGVHV